MRLFDGGERDPKALIAVVRARIAEPGGIRVDYVAVVDPETFADVPMATVKTKILVAARISDVRLIDVVRLGRDALPVPPAGIS
jgi:pantothenate synthetase